MPTARRQFLSLAAALTAGLPFTAGAQALGKPVHMIVAYGAGSASDTIARYLSERIARKSGRSVVVENKPGVDGNLAAEAATRASGDAYTLLVSGASTHAANAAIYKKLPFDPEADFTPLATLAQAPFILLVNPQRIAQRTLKDFLAWAGEGDRSLSFASTSVGNRIAGEQFRQVTRMKAVNVPYRTSGQAMTDLLGGQFDFYFCDAATALPQIKAGKAVALAVSTANRLAPLPDVPTLAESGYAGFDVASWIAIWSTVASTPPAVSTQLAAWIGEALEAPEGREFLQGKGLLPTPISPQHLRALQQRDTVAWGKIIRDTGMQQP